MAVSVGHITRYQLGDLAAEVGPAQLECEVIEQERTIFRLTSRIRWLRYVDGVWQEIAEREMEDGLLQRKEPDGD